MRPTQTERKGWRSGSGTEKEREIDRKRRAWCEKIGSHCIFSFAFWVLKTLKRKREFVFWGVGQAFFSFHVSYLCVEHSHCVETVKSEIEKKVIKLRTSSVCLWNEHNMEIGISLNWWGSHARNLWWNMSPWLFYYSIVFVCGRSFCWAVCVCVCVERAERQFHFIICLWLLFSEPGIGNVPEDIIPPKDNITSVHPFRLLTRSPLCSLMQNVHTAYSTQSSLHAAQCSPG